MSDTPEYTLIELQLVLRHMDEVLASSFRGDLYTEVARRAFSVEEPTREQRNLVKRMAFARMYGGPAKGLTDTSDPVELLRVGRPPSVDEWVKGQILQLIRRPKGG